MLTKECDVLIVGGGISGLSAAISASETGNKVILIERNPYFGGQATHSLVTSFCGFYTRGMHPDLIVGGVGKKVLEKLVDFGFDITAHPSKSTGNSSIKFDPEILKIILDELMSKSDVDFYLHTNLIGVNKDNNSISSVICLDDEDIFEIKAKAYIDATGNANLVSLADIETKWGDEHGDVQQSSLSFRLDNLPRREILNSELETAIKKAKKAGIPNLHKEKGMIIKSIEANYGYCTIPSVKLKNLSGKEKTYAEIELRKQMYSYAKAFKKFIPDFKEIQIVTSGPEIGVREARRIIGKEQLAGIDVLSGKKCKTSIGRAGWSPEIHKNDTSLEYTYIADNDYADIPLGVLEVKECTNLWAAGRIISSDPMAFGSIRVMGTGFATGQAAGIAAAMFCMNQYNYDRIKQELLKQGALI